MKKIYVFVEGQMGEDLIGCALCEDGTVLAQHLSSTREFVKLDLGITGQRHHRIYTEHCPMGYVLVDLTDYTDAMLLAHAGFQEANAAYEEEQLRERRTPKRGTAREPVLDPAHGRRESAQRSLDL